jgi:hypothetical protein
MAAARSLMKTNRPCSCAFEFRRFGPSLFGQLECATLGESHQHGPHRGGCHERSLERSSAVLLLGRVRYGDCDRGRDPAHLTGVPSRRQPVLSFPSLTSPLTPSGDRLAQRSMRWGPPRPKGLNSLNRIFPLASSSLRFPLCPNLPPRVLGWPLLGMLAQSISADVLEGERLRGRLGRRRLWPQSHLAAPPGKSAFAPATLRWP